MKLVLPSVQYKESFIEAVKEYQADTSNALTNEMYNELDVAELEAHFDTYASEQVSHARGENLRPGWVPCSNYWLIDNEEFIGALRIRHTLSGHLVKTGGHIGYDIRPTKRRQGYGSAILSLALPEAKKLGIERILVTCDETNEASRKIIERNGGVLENSLPNGDTGVDKLRFWIE